MLCPEEPRTSRARGLMQVLSEMVRSTLTYEISEGNQITPLISIRNLLPPMVGQLISEDLRLTHESIEINFF